MADRDFEFVKTVEDGRPASAFRITCGRCPATAVFLQHGAKRKPPELAASHFRNKGWAVGRIPRLDRCPDCRPASISRGTTPMPNATPAPAPAVEAPREMTREDRRIVFAKLNDVYLGEHEGYSAGWTDQKVADDLGVPRAWIATIREENFGPVRENEASAALRAELRRLQEAHDSIVRTSLEIENDVTKRMGRLRADGERVKGEMQALAGRIDRAL